MGALARASMGLTQVPVQQVDPGGLETACPKPFRWSSLCTMHHGLSCLRTGGGFAMMLVAEEFLWWQIGLGWEAEGWTW